MEDNKVIFLTTVSKNSSYKSTMMKKKQSLRKNVRFTYVFLFLLTYPIKEITIDVRNTDEPKSAQTELVLSPIFKSPWFPSF